MVAPRARSETRPRVPGSWGSVALARGSARQKLARGAPGPATSPTLSSAPGEMAEVAASVARPGPRARGPPGSESLGEPARPGPPRPAPPRRHSPLRRRRRRRRTRSLRRNCPARARSVVTSCVGAG